MSPPSVLIIRYSPLTSGGADRDRTDDLRLAKPALSQLSYSPGFKCLAGNLCPALNGYANDRSAASFVPKLRGHCLVTEGIERLLKYLPQIYLYYLLLPPRLLTKLLVGLGRVELPTSPLSGVRSNQLSYRPVLVYGRYLTAYGSVPTCHRAIPPSRR